MKAKAELLFKIVPTPTVREFSKSAPTHRYNGTYRDLRHAEANRDSRGRGGIGLVVGIQPEPARVSNAGARGRCGYVEGTPTVATRPDSAGRDATGGGR